MTKKVSWTKDLPRKSGHTPGFVDESGQKSCVKIAEKVPKMG